MSDLTLDERLAFAQRMARDNSRSAAFRAAARRRIVQLEAQKRPSMTQRDRLVRYRIGGIWKLSERIADRDIDGDYINGYSDKV